MNLNLRRSLLNRQHQSLKATFDEQSGLVLSYGDGQNGNKSEFEQSRKLGLCDLSGLCRTGFKGPGTNAWLQNQKLSCPPSPNRSTEQSSGALIARLSADEHLILDNLNGSSELPQTLNHEWSLDTAEHCYQLPRHDSHGWLALTGMHAAETMSKVCAVDLRAAKFANLRIAQTSVARTNAVVVRRDLPDNCLCYYLLFDISMSEFVWSSLLDAMAEFNGTPIGLNAMRQHLSIIEE